MKSRLTQLACSVITVLMLATAASAQSLPTQAERRAADFASYGTVATALVLDARDAWQAPDRQHALEVMAMRDFTTYVLASLAKNLFPATRPCAQLPEGCGIDRADTSFYSMHTAFAWSALGGPRLSVEVTLASSTAGLRVGAGKHRWVDVLTGAGIGALTSRIR